MVGATPNSSTLGSETDLVETLDDGTVLILGGGPVGMMTATTLAFYGVRTVVLERNLTTTKWPKMDLTNVRSMEFFRKLGLAQDLRQRGVPSDIPYTVLMSSGLSQPRPLSQWNHLSVDEYRQKINSNNDGTMPLEPWQRISQEIFEAWLKELSETNELINILFGWKLESILETENGVEAKVTDLARSKSVTFKARFAVGCDGASSRVRRGLEIPLDGGPVPGFVLLVHFKSNDLANLHKQGRFWHLFMAGEHVMGGAAISQDEKDTFTTHLFLPLDEDESKISTEEAVYRVFGGMYGPYKVKIDKVLVRSTYRPSIAVARHYSSSNGRIFLAGDSAHQNIPTGGYGMNMGLGDAYDIAWKLAAVIQGWAGHNLLESYEEERRPVALMNVERSGVHMSVHAAIPRIIEGRVSELDSDSEKGRELRQLIHEHYQANDGENCDLGIEMGYRYKSRAILSEENNQPPWNARNYYPTTWPGSRPPHMFLTDGSAIFDHFGQYFTLVNFGAGPKATMEVKYFEDAARELGIPLNIVNLKNEDHARKLWERDLVLIRPDGHVSWRGDGVHDKCAVNHLLKVSVGRGIHAAETDQNMPGKGAHATNDDGKGILIRFTMTEEIKSQSTDYKLEKMGHFQQ